MQRQYSRDNIPVRRRPPVADEYLFCLAVDYLFCLAADILPP